MKMIIEEQKIKLIDLYEGFTNDQENGTKAYHGMLDIRPPFQREFVYKGKQKEAVIETINKGYPLNIMYWSKNEDGTYELLDGQQRTLSALTYMNGDFSVNHKGFANLTPDEKEKIQNYECMIYICEGTQSEKLEWFRVVNIAGLKLEEQELRNSQYTGQWLYDAKRHFSMNNCPASHLGSRYLEGQAIRQKYLETALKWISDRDGCQIEDYMAAHQHDDDANELWRYFQSVIAWIEIMFPTYREEIMKGVDWGYFYNHYKDNNNVNSCTAAQLEEKIQKLINDDDVQNKKGICPYLLTGQEKFLNLREFSTNQKTKAYEKQQGICNVCKKHFSIGDMEGDHIIPWSQGGKTIDDNCQMLCKRCNRIKGGM